MSVALAFPQSLNPPTISGYEASYLTATLLSDPDFGPGRLRPLYTTPPRKVSVAWEFFDFEFARFDNWFLNTVKNGTQKFDIQLSDNDQGLIWYTACFTGGWKAEQQQPGLTWIITADLLLYGEPFTTRPFYGALDGIATWQLDASVVVTLDKGFHGLVNWTWDAAAQIHVDVAAFDGISTIVLTATARFGTISTGPLFGDTDAIVLDAVAVFGSFFTGLLAQEDGTSNIELENGTDFITSE